MAEQWPDDSIFEPFNIFQTTYKTVGSHEIQAAVLIPKDLKPGPHPLITSVHGGFLMTAHSLFAPFFSPWVVDLALQDSAIIVSPDYRLLPSANGVADVLEDLEDFWEWSRTDLPKVVEQRAPEYHIDFNRLLLAGGSAGGYAAVQLALSHVQDVSMLAMAYPLVDVKDHIFITGPKEDEPSVLRFPIQDMPSKENLLTWIDEKRQTVTSKAGFERGAFNAASAQYGLFYSHVFDNNGLNRSDFLPMERIRAGAALPRHMWILQGDDDSVVHIRGINKFVDLVKDKLPDTRIRLDVALGKDHAFDHLNTNWATFISPGALDFIREGWLGN